MQQPEMLPLENRNPLGPMVSENWMAAIGDRIYTLPPHRGLFNMIQLSASKVTTDAGQDLIVRKCT